MPPHFRLSMESHSTPMGQERGRGQRTKGQRAKGRGATIGKGINHKQKIQNPFFQERKIWVKEKKWRARNTFEEHKHWRSDGAFKVTSFLPTLCSSFALWRSCFPGYMQNKTQNSYERALRKISNLKPDLKPNTLFCDFQNVFITVFYRYDNIWLLISP